MACYSVAMTLLQILARHDTLCMVRSEIGTNTLAERWVDDDIHVSCMGGCLLFGYLCATVHGDCTG